jgi:hypothetical protein
VDRSGSLGLNESWFRSVNERLIAREMPAASKLTIVCECGRSDCRERIRVTRAEWKTARSEDELFLVKRGHSRLDTENVISSNGDHELVRKTGEAARTARDFRPRP